jgi:cell fate regulator YaaT (PSP1 superfamily)
MAKVVGVRFRPGDKLYYCDAGDEITAKAGDYAVVETPHGLDLAKVVISQAEIDDCSELVRLIRRARAEDIEQDEQNQEKGREALVKCKEMATKLNLAIKPLLAHYNLDGSHLTVFFGAGERVDFRELIRRLSRSLKTRVELRQVGPRDEARLVGGIGRCGYPLCCQTFLSDFLPVSIRMAKEQNLALNPTKISGLCGRLLCCLGYETKQYAQIKERMPQIGQEVSTPLGKGEVVDSNPLKETVTLRLEDGTRAELLLNELDLGKALQT